MFSSCLFEKEKTSKQMSTNIHYEYTHDKWCTVAYLKKQVGKKNNHYTKQQQTRKKNTYIHFSIYIYKEKEDDTYLPFDFIVQINFVIFNLCTCWCS